METQQLKVLRWKDGHSSPDNLTGHIIVFDDPLIVHQTKEVKDKRGWTHLEATGKIANCYFMRAEGGFGSYARCSGRMILGKLYETIQDVLDNKPFEEGNTKCFPNGYIPELFTEHEKL